MNYLELDAALIVRQCLLSTFYPIQHHRYGDDMPSTEASSLTVRVAEIATAQPTTLNSPDSLYRKPPRSTSEHHSSGSDPYLRSMTSPDGSMAL